MNLEFQKLGIAARKLKKRKFVLRIIAKCSDIFLRFCAIRRFWQNKIKL